MITHRLVDSVIVLLVGYCTETFQTNAQSFLAAERLEDASPSPNPRPSYYSLQVYWGWRSYEKRGWTHGANQRGQPRSDSGVSLPASGYLDTFG
jgi:hypothetical protein